MFVMWFAYIDESKDQNKFCVYSALVIDADRWAETNEKLKAFRRSLRDRYGIFISHELHAWKFAAGKGRVSDRVLLKPQCAQVFREVLRFIAESKFASVMSSCNTTEQYAFERLMNRIDRTAVAKKQNVLLFFDEGAEIEITRRIRKMKVHNYIPSQIGRWGSTGSTAKNIPLSRIVEDPVFKDSKQSNLIQLVDFCAYALLRMERPIPSRTELGYDTMYEELRPVSRAFTNTKDPRGMGIIR